MSKINITPLEFIKENLQLLASSFKGISIKYEYNESISTHIVELTPEYEYYHNEELDKAWIPISSNFKTLFEDEDISFISSDSSLRVTKPISEWNQKNESVVELLDFQFSEKISHYLDKHNATDIYFPSSVELITLPDFSAFINSIDTSVKTSFINSNLDLDYQFISVFNEQESKKYSEEASGDSNFAMAA
ncbi:hypothetical protein PV783_29345 [Chitinophaga sp. CC14]|uniref:hypothetical protein n=1 Tax=Chitinophaga sp. CC14 TaxID=3029199 RepID=UPI003B7BBCA4